MRLSDEEFGALTLVSFQLLNERLHDQRQHDQFCAGIVASTIANMYGNETTPLDFIPGYRAEEKPAEGLKPLSPEEQVAAFEGLFNPPKFTKLVR